MKRFIYSLLLLGGLFGTLSIITHSCTDRQTDRKEQIDSTPESKVKISNFDLKATTKSAEQSYRLSIMGDTAFLTLSASVQWPENIGGCDIKLFQDSIISLSFPRDIHKGEIDKSISSFVCDIDIMGDSVEFVPVASIPKEDLNERAYEISVTGKLLEVTEAFVTYQVINYSYTGGAHPNTFSFPFTYALKDKKVLTMENMFKPGSEEALTQVVREALARQYNVPAQHLTAAGLFSDNVPMSHNIYILNGALIFHYNTYDIAPYYMGAINAEVYPYEIEAYLTPMGVELFN